MKTKRSQEAYVLIDHRDSPGISPEFVRANGLDAPAVGAGQTFESAVVVCSHCGADVILNPNRTRHREWCYACDAYICDGCALAVKLGAPHTSMRQLFDDAYDALATGKEFIL